MVNAAPGARLEGEGAQSLLKKTAARAVEKLNVVEAMRLLEVDARLERLARGETTDRLSIREAEKWVDHFVGIAMAFIPFDALRVRRRRAAIRRSRDRKVLHAAPQESRAVGDGTQVGRGDDHPERGSEDNLRLSPREREQKPRRERKRRPPRDTPEVADAICRLIRALGRRVAEEDPDGLAQLRLIEDELSEALAVAVAGLRRSAFTDEEIGRVLGGVTKQAVAKRWRREEAP
jgi:hypothetical protein